MDASAMASEPHFAICPMCEETKLVFSGLYSARCPECGYEPNSEFLKTLRQIVTLPDLPEISRRPSRGSEPERRRPADSQDTIG